MRVSHPNFTKSSAQQKPHVKTSIPKYTIASWAKRGQVQTVAVVDLVDHDSHPGRGSHRLGHQVQLSHRDRWISGHHQHRITQDGQRSPSFVGVGDVDRARSRGVHHLRTSSGAPNRALTSVFLPRLASPSTSTRACPCTTQATASRNAARCRAGTSGPSSAAAALASLARSSAHLPGRCWCSGGQDLSDGSSRKPAPSPTMMLAAALMTANARARSCTAERFRSQRWSKCSAPRTARRPGQPSPAPGYANWW